MANQGVYDRKTYYIDGATLGSVKAGTIVSQSTVNDNAATVGTLGALNLIGVTIEDTDLNGMAGVRLCGVVMVTVGAGNLTRGQRVKSDASGHAVVFTPAAAGAGVLKGTLGIVNASALAGNAVEVLIDLSNMFE